MLQKLQKWLFEKGANKPYGVWGKLGNLTQDVRSTLRRKKGAN